MDATPKRKLTREQYLAIEFFAIAVGEW